MNLVQTWRIDSTGQLVIARGLNEVSFPVVFVSRCGSRSHNIGLLIEATNELIGKHEHISASGCWILY